MRHKPVELSITHLKCNHKHSDSMEFSKPRQSTTWILNKLLKWVAGARDQTLHDDAPAATKTTETFTQQTTIDRIASTLKFNFWLNIHKFNTYAKHHSTILNPSMRMRMIQNKTGFPICIIEYFLTAAYVINQQVLVKKKSNRLLTDTETPHDAENHTRPTKTLIWNIVPRGKWCWIAYVQT